MEREEEQPSPLASTDGVRVRIPSKVNLFLAVRGARDDGLHEIVSIMQTVGLYDHLRVTVEGTGLAQHPAARRFMGLTFDYEGPTAIPSGEDNLAVRAAARLLEEIGSADPGPQVSPGTVPTTHLQLRKNIPVAAGMAGGSADAAAALIACNHLWHCGLDADGLRALAAEIGADVPFCVTGGTALATGTGTATARVLARGRYHWVVGISDDPLSTPAVYRAWDEHCAPSEVEPDAVLHALRTGDAEALGAALHNDLAEAAFALRPALRDKCDALHEAGALGVVVSGSGPTVVALAESGAHAAGLAATARGWFDRVEVATSPAGGPELTAEAG